MFDSEPPSSPASGDAIASVVGRLMAVAHLPEGAHVAIIGRRTLPYMLALLQHGCGAARSLRPGEPSPDCEAADLCWIVDARDEGELDDALRAARNRAGGSGRVVVEGSRYAGADGLSAIPGHALTAGLQVVSYDHAEHRVVLSARH